MTSNREQELLARIAETLRREIGPAVDAEYPRTQAFMAAVVLQKLGAELAAREAHEAAAAADMDALLNDLQGRFDSELPQAVTSAVQALAVARDASALCSLLETLYAHRNTLGDGLFEALLGRVRETLRADIDRRMEYAS